VVSQLESAVVTAANSEYIVVGVYPLENPELINFTMAGPLDNILLVFVLLFKDLQVQSVEMTLDHVYFTSTQDVPSLIVPIISSIEANLLTFSSRCFRDVNQLSLVIGDNEAWFIKIDIICHRLEIP